MGDLTRRNLLTTGVWSAPVLLVAVAAPMAAASPVIASAFVWTPSTATVPSGTRVDTRLAIANQGTGPMVGPITVVVSGLRRGGGQSISLVAGSAPGWTAGNSDSVTSRTFIWSGTVAAGSSTVALPMEFYQSGSPGVSVIAASESTGQTTTGTLSIIRT